MVDFSKFVDPFKLIEAALNAVVDAFRAWRGFRLVIFGETEVGKTTLWHFLQSEKIVDPSKVDKTIEIDTLNKFRIKSIKLSFIKVGILATDLPGDPEYRGTWREVLYNVKPHGIVFLIDHAKGKPASQKEVDLDRAKSHYDAFAHLAQLIFDNPEVTGALRALAVVVNKIDALPSEIQGYGEVYERSGLNRQILRFDPLENCRTTVFGCSALYGTQVMPMVEWMVKGMAGR